MSDQRIEGEGVFQPSTPDWQAQRSFEPGIRKCLRATFDEFVQWMVPDPSFDRRDRWGLKLT
jgi:hypothetical protein